MSTSTARTSNSLSASTAISSALFLPDPDGTRMELIETPKLEASPEAAQTPSSSATGSLD